MGFNANRASGILLHISSLPNRYGIGTLGTEAYKFVDYLKSAKQKYWQVLPLGHTGYGDSPYQTFSAFAGNPILIDLEALFKAGYIEEKDLAVDSFSVDRVDYGAIIPYKYSVLEKAYKNFLNTVDSQYERFLEENAFWLNDYALFMSLKDKFAGKSWLEWPDEYRLYSKELHKTVENELEYRMSYYKFMQFIFFKQWLALKDYANDNGIRIIGDIPIYVAMDSVEAWSKWYIFHFDERRRPSKVAGVPPDYFSKTGQLWGNPLYNWDKLRENSFSWWHDRVREAIKLYDLVRIDHFRGFASYYAVPYGDKTAENGWWEQAYGDELFASLKEKFGNIPIIAEDLGIITDDVVELRDKYQFPGMKIIQFGFDSVEGSPYIPHLFDKNCVAYTGTHDNDTIVGWYHNASASDREFVNKYLNVKTAENINRDFIRLTYASVANLVLFPMQDILGLGSEARMNIPGNASGNWQWRLKEDELKQHDIDYLAELSYIYGR